MYAAAALANVGPMAAVAGTMAQLVAEDLGEYCSEVLVENGGDLYLISTRERVVGLLAKPLEGVRLGLRLTPEDFPVSLCASSASIGHSLSLGAADLVVVRSASGSVADAFATALANRLKTAGDVQAVLDAAAQHQADGVDGVFVQAGDQIGAWGRMELAPL
jgi:hypothetical protein